MATRFYAVVQMSMTTTATSSREYCLSIVHRIGTYAILTFCVALAAGAPAPSFGAGLSCPPRHGFLSVLRSDRQAVVYEGLNSEGLNEVFGCVRGATRRYGLGMTGGASEEGGAGLRLITLVGHVVAWEEYSFNGPGEPERSKNVIFVRDLLDGRLLHRLPTGPSTAPNEIGVGPAVRLVVKGDGAVVWITGGTVEGIKRSVIHVADRSGVRVVGSGTGIDRGSLRLKGSMLSWRQNGKQFSAVLR